MTANGENNHTNGNGNGNGGAPRLTGMQRAFVDAWFGEAKFNGTEAARLAGYSGGDDPARSRAVWSVAAAQVLGSTSVQAEIARRWKAHGVTPEEIIARLGGWMRFDPSVCFHPHGGLDWEKVRQHGRHIKRIEWDKGNKLKVEWHDPVRAAELIARTLGMFRDKVEQEHTGEVVVRFAKPAEYPE